MRRWFGMFAKAEDGYVAVLTLVSMPFIAMMALLMWDVGRGNNLHTDIQNAVDATALAGARELDGSPSAIDRAEAAMSDLLQNQARFSNDGRVVMDADRLRWRFLHSIPPHDDMPLDASYETTDPSQAAFVRVWALNQPMESWFLRVSGLQQDVPFSAEAVATYTMAACDVTPIFMCNPFEGMTPSLESRFSSGDLYARQFRMNLAGGSGSPGPGNFGFLRFGGGTGAAALGKALATSRSEACYTTNSLETEPGVSLGQSIPGINTRFGIYEGAMGSNRTDHAYRPALNVRKGASNPNACGSYSVAAPEQAVPLPEGALSITFPGGSLHSANWSDELEDYWQVNHPAHVSNGTVNVPDIPRTSHPVDGSIVWPPSRYDIYRYEIEQTYGGAQNLLADPDEPNPAGHMSPNGERGVPRTGAANSCYNGSALSQSDAVDRRIIFSALVNCNAAAAAGELNGQKTISPENVVGFASMFMTRPGLHSGNTRRIYLEMLDLTGEDGNGTLDLFLRQEALLVR